MEDHSPELNSDYSTISLVPGAIGGGDWRCLGFRRKPLLHCNAPDEANAKLAAPRQMTGCIHLATETPSYH